MISFTCPSCNEILQIPERYIGQKGRCNKCGSQIEIIVAPPELECEPNSADCVVKGADTKLTPLKTFDTEIVDVTFENMDGNSRQNIIQECTEGEPLQLIRERDNPDRYRGYDTAPEIPNQICSIMGRGPGCIEG